MVWLKVEDTFFHPSLCPDKSSFYTSCIYLWNRGQWFKMRSFSPLDNTNKTNIFQSSCVVILFSCHYLHFPTLLDKVHIIPMVIRYDSPLFWVFVRGRTPFPALLINGLTFAKTQFLNPLLDSVISQAL